MKNLFKFLFIAMVVSCSPTSGRAQRMSLDLSNKERKYANTLMDLAQYLKATATPRDTAYPGLPNVASFYNKTIESYFDKKRTTLEFSTSDTNYFNVDGKFYMQRVFLNLLDNWLDKIPKDSLTIVSGKHVKYYDKDDPEDTDEFNNSLSIAFGINQMTLFLIWFDEKSWKVISLFPYPLTHSEIKTINKYLLSK